MRGLKPPCECHECVQISYESSMHMTWGHEMPTNKNVAQEIPQMMVYEHDMM